MRNDDTRSALLFVACFLSGVALLALAGWFGVLRPGFETPGWAYSGGQL